MIFVSCSLGHDINHILIDIHFNLGHDDIIFIFVSILGTIESLDVSYGMFKIQFETSMEYTRLRRALSLFPYTPLEWRIQLTYHSKEVNLILRVLFLFSHKNNTTIVTLTVDRQTTNVKANTEREHCEREHSMPHIRKEQSHTRGKNTRIKGISYALTI